MSQNDHTISLSSSLLQELEMALNDNSYEMQWYLDLQEEKLTFIAENYGLEEQQEIAEAIEQDEKGRFVEVPRRTSSEGWKQMEQFIISLDDQTEDTRDRLFDAIQGKGAFRRFKDRVYDMDLQDRWYEFKNRQDRQRSLEWLRARDLITDEQVEEGVQILEDRINRKKQREKEISEMVAGKRVRCIQTAGHGDKLTEGKEYEVLDEQRQHLNIRVKDDRGQECWLPKSHFELME